MQNGPSAYVESFVGSGAECSVVRGSVAGSLAIAMSPKRSRGFAEVTPQSDGAGRPDRTIAPPIETPRARTVFPTACGRDCQRWRRRPERLQARSGGQPSSRTKCLPPSVLASKRASVRRPSLRTTGEPVQGSGDPSRPQPSTNNGRGRQATSEAQSGSPCLRIQSLCSVACTTV
jgi:hypothetical protein